LAPAAQPGAAPVVEARRAAATRAGAPHVAFVDLESATVPT
jgi:hypothetical protein